MNSPLNKEQIVVNTFLHELSEKVGRNKRTLIDEGLIPSDFNYDDIKLHFNDGSYLFFKHSFYLRRYGKVGVFTAKCGHFIFDETLFSHIEIFNPLVIDR